jgi:surfeit locus 1 family protein
MMTLLALLSLGLLVWLGNWQYGRYREKLILDASPPALKTLQGAVIGGSDVLLYAYADGVSGWQRLVAVDAGDRVVWASAELFEQVRPPQITPLAAEGTRLSYAADGLFTTPSGRSVFGGADKPEARLYQTFMATKLGIHLPEDVRARVSPELFQPATIRFQREGRAVDGRNPLARARADAQLSPERHFGYAITWWGLAAALIGVYLAFHHRAGRLRFSARGKENPS